MSTKKNYLRFFLHYLKLPLTASYSTCTALNSFAMWCCRWATASSRAESTELELAFSYSSSMSMSGLWSLWLLSLLLLLLLLVTFGSALVMPDSDDKLSMATNSSVSALSGLTEMGSAFRKRIQLD